jgi:hypothetical protein
MYIYIYKLKTEVGEREAVSYLQNKNNQKESIALAKRINKKDLQTKKNQIEQPHAEE